MQLVTIVCATALAGALAGATLAFTVATPTQDAQAGAQDEAEMMAAFERAATPGPQHAELAKTAGTWTTRMKHYSAPDSPPMESVGTSTIEPIMDGRYMLEHFESDIPMMGAFRGMGVSGYDNVAQEYVATWIDNMGTGILITRGQRDANGVLEMRGEYADAMGQGQVPLREVLREVSPDEKHFTMYETRDGTERMLFELVYTRAPSGGHGADDGHGHRDGEGHGKPR